MVVMIFQQVVNYLLLNQIEMPFRFSSGSIGNPPFQQIQFKTSQQNLTGSVTYVIKSKHLM